MPRFSIYSWFGFFIPMAEGCRLIKSAGFDAIMLFWGNDYVNSDVESARRNGLLIENIHAPFEDINHLWEDNIAGDQLEQELGKCIADCSQFEIPTAVLHVTQGDTPPPWNWIGLERLKRLVEIAERNQINIALENLRRPEYLDFIFDNIQSGRLGFCYDSGHENCYSKGGNLLSKYGSKLMALHLHDNDGTEDQHQIPGKGTIDWRSLKRELEATGYQGAIALEVIHQLSPGGDLETPEQFVKRTFEAAYPLFSEFDESEFCRKCSR
jgi:Sugar phosphate isomerases/epimerases